jgi:hypothetical protein
MQGIHTSMQTEVSLLLSQERTKRRYHGLTEPSPQPILLFF